MKLASITRNGCVLHARLRNSSVGESLEPFPNDFGLSSESHIQIFVDHHCQLADLFSMLEEIGVNSSEIRKRGVEGYLKEGRWIAAGSPRNVCGKLTIKVADGEEAGDLAEVVLIQPSAIFGNGRHPTTSLALEWLCQYVKPGSSIVDYGCGTGILALAAAKLGSVSAYCFDTDEGARASVLSNVRLNKLEGKVKVVDHESKIPTENSIVIANVSGLTTVKLAKNFIRLLSYEGSLVLPGLLAEDVKQNVEHYSKKVGLEVFGSKAGYVCVHGIRTLSIDVLN